VRKLIVVGVLIFGALVSRATSNIAQAGDSPRYLILRRDNRGQATIVPAQPYAYGWFGAMPSSASWGHRSYSGTIYTWTFTPGY
jgi:hypothetical protein